MVSENNKARWLQTLEIVEQSITAESFLGDLDFLRERYGETPGRVAAARVGILAEFFVEMIGLDTLLLPLEEVPDALAETRRRLNDLDFESPRAELGEDELAYYEAFANFADLIFSRMGNAMEAMLNIYIAEDYDPEADPNALIVEALEMADEDPNQAQDQISRAGATALHGQPIWWRWEEEAYGPAAPWLRTTATLVEDYTFGRETPMGPPEQARKEMQEIVERVESEEPAEEEEAEKEEPTSTPVDDLIEELIRREGAPITEEQIALCEEYRAEAIRALTYLAQNEELQMEDSPGDGYTPIRAVQLLSELEAAEAIPTLIDLVADNDPSTILYSVSAITLEEMGPLARDDVLTFLRYSQDVEAKTSLASMLDSMTDPDDEEAYQLLIEVWEESTWEYGKCMLGYPLIHLGDEEAAEWIRQTLAEEDLDPIDHNELVAALEEAGLDAPPAKELDRVNPTLQAIRDLGDPQEFLNFAAAVPEMREEPETLAQEYVDSARTMLVRTTSVILAILPVDELQNRIEELLESIEKITFDDPPPGYPDYALAAYAALAESAGPEFRGFGIGMLLPFKAYLDREYDPDQSPDELIATARGALPDTQQARVYFAQAGAVALSGAPLWDLWPLETPDPLADWLVGFFSARDMLEAFDQIPFEPSESIEQSKLWDLDEEEVPPQVEEIIDLIFEWQGDWIPPVDRPDFARHRSELTPELIRIVQNPKYAYDTAPGGGWAPILAVRVLGAIRAKAAADTLVWSVVLSNPQAYIHDAAIFSLIALGPAALPAVKRYYRYGQDVTKKATLAEVLGLVGQKDPEVFPLMKDVWEAADWTQNRRAVALAFGDLGDPRAEPLLREAAQNPRADTLDRDYVWLAMMELGIKASPPPQTLSNRLRTPAPASPRVIYNEMDRPQRLEHTAWGEAICPDCGDLMIEDKRGRLVHLGVEPSALRKPRQR